MEAILAWGSEDVGDRATQGWGQKREMGTAAGGGKRRAKPNKVRSGSNSSRGKTRSLSLGYWVLCKETVSFSPSS